MSSHGYGNCGHTNSYSSSVNIGNFVEDRMGLELAKNMKSHSLSCHSEASASYIHPTQMIDKSAQAPPFNETEAFIHRQGLPYNLMFGHGEQHPTTQNHPLQYVTTSKLPLHSKTIPSTDKREEDGNFKRKEREKQLAREKREIKGFITSSKAASSRLMM